MRARLMVEAGIASPRVCELSPGGIARLGRDRENTIVLKDRYASRWHAQVYASNGRWYIRDQKTTNGTRVDGQPVQPEAALEDGQHIHIGGVRPRFAPDPSKQ